MRGYARRGGLGLGLGLGWGCGAVSLGVWVCGWCAESGCLGWLVC